LKELQRNMQQFIGCDAHKKFSVFAFLNEKGEYGKTVRVGHDREVFRKFLNDLPANSQIALETSGSYYWIVDEIEAAGHQARLAHALVAKRRMEGRHKTDQKDARGLAMLLRNGTLPEVWIPPRELRDEREMLRWRMSLSGARTRVKNRIHAVLQRYNLEIGCADIFGNKGRCELFRRMPELPSYSAMSVEWQLRLLDSVESQIGECDEALEKMLERSVERDILDTLPGVGKVLSAVLSLEIGKVERFPNGEELASYAGVVKAARESAGHKGVERCPRDCNVYLKWAYVEAANVISLFQKQWGERHVVQLYQRIRQSSKMHGKAATAVARHLAEASYWMLKKQEPYKEPHAGRQVLSSTQG
jgi:transposase